MKTALKDVNMLNFQAVRERKLKLSDLAAGLSRDDLRKLTNEMIDKVTELLRDCSDADVVFQPIDPIANDTFAAKEADRGLAWTLGHVIVHGTASSEESAFLAAEMARGVANHGRSRSEVPWETVTTIKQCRDRLEESRRMRLAMLDAWPAEAHLHVVYEPYPGASEMNAVARFIGGLSHEDSHLGQIAEIVKQAHAGRADA
jgi:DinB superfamily